MRKPNFTKECRIYGYNDIFWGFKISAKSCIIINYSIVEQKQRKSEITFDTQLEGSEYNRPMSHFRSLFVV